MSIALYDDFFKEGKTIVTVKDVPAPKFISAFAQHLKRQGRFEIPKWADVVKTGKQKELAPYDADWLYVRSASMVRKIYIRGGSGVGGFRKVYGGQKRRGTQKKIFVKGSGKIIRYIFQQLEEMGLVEQDEEGGRNITKEGQRELDTVAVQAAGAEEEEDDECIDAIYISRKIFKRMKNYVTYRIACTIQLLLFFFVAVLAIHPDMSTICLSTTVDADTSTPPIHYNASICKPDVAYYAFDIGSMKTPDGKTGFDALDTCDNTKKSFHEICKCMITNGNGAFNIGLPGDDCNPQYFKIPVIALVLITILNDGTIISIAYDNVKPSSMPEQWNLIRVCITAFILGVVACSSTLVLLFLGMNSGLGNNDDVLNNIFRLPPISLKQLECLIYLKISLSDFLTVFSARTNGFFFTLRPGNLLMMAFCLATFCSTIFAATWPFGDMEPLPANYILFVWLYCICFFFIQDTFKVLSNIVLDKVFEVTSNSAKRTKKRVQVANRKMIENERRQHGDKFSSKRHGLKGPNAKNYSQMDMATALHRINDLSAELLQLKQVVERHSGMVSSSEIESKSPNNGVVNRKRSNKSYLSQKSRDMANRSRSRSESKNW